MELLSFVIPLIAAGSLTAALVVPFRDARRGDRATLAPGSPLLARSDPAAALEATELDKTVEARAQDPTHQRERGSHGHAAVRLTVAMETCLSRVFTLVRMFRGRAQIAHDTELARVEHDDVPFADRVAALVRGPSDARQPMAPNVDPGPGTFVTDVEPHDEEPPSKPEPPLAPVFDDRAREDIALTATARLDVPPPLTRTRLRPQRCGAAWPTLLPMPHVGLARDARHGLLRDLARECDSSYEPALVAAFVEEDSAGRLLVLEALARQGGARSKAILVDALRGGSDDERVLAIDLFVRRGDRDSLEAALDDRVDAIVARAALAYVGSNERAAFERVLSQRLDGTRRAAVLAMLAGFLT